MTDLHKLRQQEHDRLRKALIQALREATSAESLLRQSKVASDLAKAATVLRHNLPERADSQLALTARGFPRDRYHMVWPDGERHERPYSHRPAVLKRWELIRETYPEVRLYDSREAAFISPIEAGVNEVRLLSGATETSANANRRKQVRKASGASFT